MARLDALRADLKTFLQIPQPPTTKRLHSALGLTKPQPPSNSNSPFKRDGGFSKLSGGERADAPSPHTPTPPRYQSFRKNKLSQFLVSPEGAVYGTDPNFLSRKNWGTCLFLRHF